MHKGELTVESDLAKENEIGHITFTITLLKGKTHFKPEHLLAEGKEITLFVEHTSTLIPDELTNGGLNKKLLFYWWKIMMN